MIYVLGARGFVGSTVLSVLQDYDDCTGIDLHNYDEYKNSECDIFVNINGNSKKFLAREKPADEFDMSVRSVVRSMYDFSFKKYVFISTVDVYTDFSTQEKTHEDTVIDTAAQSPYGFHKWLAEQYVKKNAPSWLIVRLGGMVGPHLAKGPLFDILNDIPLRVHLDSRYQYIHTAAVGKTITSLLEQNREKDIFNICGTGTLSLRTFSKMVGKDPEFPKDAHIEQYEINNSKIDETVGVPHTHDSVIRFLENAGIPYSPQDNE